MPDDYPNLVPYPASGYNTKLLTKWLTDLAHPVARVMVVEEDQGYVQFRLGFAHTGDAILYKLTWL